MMDFRDEFVPLAFAIFPEWFVILRKGITSCKLLYLLLIWATYIMETLVGSKHHDSLQAEC